jgi:predicted Zn-dependent protease
MSYIGQQLPADVFSGFTTDSFTGDGSATTFTLSKAPFSEDGLIVVINNVIQKPTTNFTVSGTTLTIVGTAVASGDVIYAIHTSGAVPSTLASKVDVNGLSDGIILDADADTTRIYS